MLSKFNHLKELSSLTKQCSRTVATTKLFIDGKFIESSTDKFLELHNPATNEIVTMVPEATLEEMNAGVAAAKRAFSSWSDTSVMARQGIMFKFQQLIKDNMGELAKNITMEQGKTLADAEGD